MSSGSAVTVEVPDIGDFEEVPIVEILVSPGDRVNVEDPLLTLESDKATMDVPAPFAGVVGELRVKVGDRVSRGTPLLTLEPAADAAAGLEPSEDAAATSDGAPSAVPAPDAARSAVGVEAQAEGAVSPSATSATTRASATSASRPPAAPVGDATRPSAAPVGDTTRPPAAPVGDGSGPIYASPSVRRLARERGIDLRSVTGTGRKGRITREDLELAVGSEGQRPAARLDLPPWPSIDFARFGPVERVERSRIQRISALNLARNWATIPHVTHNDEADITELEAWRKELNSEQREVKVTMVSFLVVASVATLKEFPTFNSSLDGDELVLKRYYNVAFAADTPGGLVVPVIKDADRKGLLQIASELTELSERARAGKLAPAEMQGATFTISSLGGIGGTSFTPIINAPEVAILGATRSAIKPVWNGSEFVPRLMLPLSLSYDHRAIDGAAAARFMVHLVKVLSDLRRALL